VALQHQWEAVRTKQLDKQWAEAKLAAEDAAAQGRYDEAIRSFEAFDPGGLSDWKARRDTMIAGYRSRKAAADDAGAATAAAAGELTHGLILYYSFDEPPANGVVPDLSGQGNPGAASGVEWTAEGRHGARWCSRPATARSA